MDLALRMDKIDFFNFFSIGKWWLYFSEKSNVRDRSFATPKTHFKICDKFYSLKNDPNRACISF